MASGSVGRWMRWKMRNKNPLTAPHPRIPVWSRRLKTLRPVDSEHPPNPSILPRSPAPRQSVAPLPQHVATHKRGGAGSKQNAATAWALAGVPVATRGLKTPYLFYGLEVRSDTGLAARHNVGLSPPERYIRLFLSPPSFFFTHEKERRGAGGLQAQTGTQDSSPHTNSNPDRIM